MSLRKPLPLTAGRQLAGADPASVYQRHAPLASAVLLPVGAGTQTSAVPLPLSTILQVGMNESAAAERARNAKKHEMGDRKGLDGSPDEDPLKRLVEQYEAASVSCGSPSITSHHEKIASPEDEKVVLVKPDSIKSGGLSAIGSDPLFQIEFPISEAVGSVVHDEHGNQLHTFADTRTRENEFAMVPYKDGAPGAADAYRIVQPAVAAAVADELAGHTGLTAQAASTAELASRAQTLALTHANALSNAPDPTTQADALNASTGSDEGTLRLRHDASIADGVDDSAKAVRNAPSQAHAIELQHTVNTVACAAQTRAAELEAESPTKVVEPACIALAAQRAIAMVAQAQSHVGQLHASLVQLHSHLKALFESLGHQLVGMTGSEAHDQCALLAQELKDATSTALLSRPDAPTDTLTTVAGRFHRFRHSVMRSLREWHAKGQHDGRTFVNQTFVRRLSDLQGEHHLHKLADMRSAVSRAIHHGATRTAYGTAMASFNTLHHLNADEARAFLDKVGGTKQTSSV